MTTTIWTIGHSTRTIDQFVDVLSAYEIELVADVRRFPGSRRYPHFGAAPLERTLEERDIAYRWFPALGGRRRAVAGAATTSWRHPAFQAYATHIETEEFSEGLFELLMLARGLRTAVMCSELLWWRCHRRLIADVLTSLGFHVIDIRDRGHAGPHRLIAPARLVRGNLRY